MELEKCRNEFDDKLSYFTPRGLKVDNNWQLLGFRDNLPMLVPVEAEKQAQLKKIKLEVDDAGQKFIKLNGKMLKVISQDKIPKEVRKQAMMVKHRTINIGSSETPLNVRVISKVTRVNAHAFKLQKDNNGAANNVNTDKAPHETTIKTYKRLRLPSQNVEELVNPRPRVSYKLLTDKNLEILNEVKMKALNLSIKQSLHPSTVSNGTDKCVQTDSCSVTEKECQTEESDSLASFGNIDFGGLLDYEDFSRESPIINNVRMGTGPVIEQIAANNKISVINSGLAFHDKSQGQMTSKKRQFFEDLNNALLSNVDGNLPIHVGVLTNDVTLVKRMCVVLKARNVGVNVENYEGCTPLQLAVLKDVEPLIVHILLNQGADLSDCDGDGNNLIHLAAKFERKVLLEVILNHQRFSTLYSHCLNSFNYEGLTPLMIAAMSGWTEGVQIFINHKAEVNIRDQKSGRTALFHAAEIHSVDIVRLLLDNKADPKIKNFFGTSPHDAMYELDNMPSEIKGLIFGKTKKRSFEAEMNPVKTAKAAKTLKTYAKLKKIEDQGSLNVVFA